MSKEIKFEFNIRMDMTSNATMEELEVETKDSYIVRVEDVRLNFNRCEHPEYMPKLATRIIPSIVREVISSYNKKDMDIGCDFDEMEDALVKCFNRDAMGEDGVICRSAVIGDIVPM